MVKAHKTSYKVVNLKNCVFFISFVHYHIADVITLKMATMLLKVGIISKFVVNIKTGQFKVLKQVSLTRPDGY